ncbi:hypothetical protein SLEP1_g33804, partial [Rubroshorea leprosula]
HLARKIPGTTAYGGAPGSGLQMDTPYGTAPGSEMTTGTGTHDVGFGTSTGGAPGSGLHIDTPYGTTLGSGRMTGTGAHDASITADQGMSGAAPTSHAIGQDQPAGPTEFQRSPSSSPGSSEDDGQGGRRKKKGLKQKIKEKLTGKHEEEQSQSISVITTTTTMKATFTAEEVPPAGQGQHQQHDSHERKVSWRRLKKNYQATITTKACNMYCNMHVPLIVCAY